MKQIFPHLLTWALVLGSAVYLWRTVMAALDNLAQEIGENTDAVNSASQLLGSLKTKLDEAIASGDMGRVQALADELDANNQRLAEAVAKNTPADPSA